MAHADVFADESLARRHLDFDETIDVRLPLLVCAPFVLAVIVALLATGCCCSAVATQLVRRGDSKTDRDKPDPAYNPPAYTRRIWSHRPVHCQVDPAAELDQPLELQDEEAGSLPSGATA